MYNKHMGGVDLLDSHIGRHKIPMKSKKWYFRVFYHLLDLCIINGWIMFNNLVEEPNQKLMQKEYRIEVAETLCMLGQQKETRGRPSDIQSKIDAKKRKYPKSIVPPKDVRLDHIDHFPQWNEKRTRCKLPGCNGYTFVSCSKCNSFLCFNKDKNCFVLYHK